MNVKKRILLKLTGEVFLAPNKNQPSLTTVNAIITQLKKLSSTHQFGIVIGGGNIFRGKEHGSALGISPSIGHQIGMLGTIMNGLVFYDLLEQRNIASSLLCAIPSPEIGTPISQQTIDKALKQDCCLIFTGGTGNPFFTTDTNAVLRGLQIKADEIWKGTKVDGVYDADPRTHPEARLIKHISYDEALSKKLAIMDATALTLAAQHNCTIRVFNIFTDEPLIRAAQDEQFGSLIT